MQDNVRRFPWRKTGETAAADLVRECGLKLTDRTLWNAFQSRFRGLIFLYLMRSLRLRGLQGESQALVQDLAQEVYVRLVQHDGRILRSFRGTSEFSVMAFLAKVASSVVHDFIRHGPTARRSGEIIPLEHLRARERGGTASPDSPEFDSSQLSAILSWIDIERIVEGEPDRKNAQRNALIFKLHYIDGFDSGEISRFPGFDLTKSGVDTVLARLKKRIQE